jgi:hypothetical protein
MRMKLYVEEKKVAIKRSNVVPGYAPRQGIAPTLLHQSSPPNAPLPLTSSTPSGLQYIEEKKYLLVGRIVTPGV